MIEILAIACFISPNPSPLVWLVSGPPRQVKAIESRVQKLAAGRLVAHASDQGVGFARFELSPRMRYGEYMELVNEIDERGLLVSEPRPMVPDCRDGRAGDLDDSHADPIVVGVVGDARQVKELGRNLTWAHLSAVELRDGRRGVSFQPAGADEAPYRDFVAKAAAGRFGSVAIVLLRPGSPRHL